MQICVATQMTNSILSNTARPTLLIVLNVVSFFLSHRKKIGAAAVQHGYRVVVCAAKDVEVFELQSMGIEFLELPNTRGRTIGLADFLYMLKIWRVYRELRPSVVHLVSPKSILFGGLMARLCRIPSVLLAFSGLGSSFVGNTLAEEIRRFLILCCFKLVVRHSGAFSIFQNSNDQRVIERIAGRSITPSILLSGSGVDLQHFFPSVSPSRTSLTITFASRLLAEKGLADFIAAAQILRDRGVAVSMQVVGQIDEYNQPEQNRTLLESAVAEGTVIYLGAFSDISQVLKETEIFCFPSYYGEGLARVLLEASASGLPVVTTDHPGCREAIIEGTTGLLVPIHRPDKVADALERLVNDKELRETMGQEARKFAEANFSLDTVVQAHLKIYGDLVRRPKKKNVIFVINSLEFFISHRLPVALAAQECGYAVHVASPGRPAYISDSMKSFAFHEVSVSRGGQNIIKELGLLFSLIRLFLKIKPGLVHLVTIKPVLYGGLAARITGVGAVISAVSGLGTVFLASTWKNKIRLHAIKALYQIAFRHQNIQIIFQNKDDAAILEKATKFHPEKAVFIRGSGVALDAYPYVKEPSGRPVVVMASRLLKDKGVGEYIAAARLLKQRAVDVDIRLIGSIDPDNPTSVTEKDLREWSSEGIVQIMGHRNDIAHQYAHANIVCLPSYREGLPKGLVEAAACGRAVVTTDVPGCRDAIIPEKTGLLVPVKDPESLANAIIQLTEDEPLRHQMGRAGRALAEEAFALEKIVGQHMDVYRKLIRNG